MSSDFMFLVALLRFDAGDAGELGPLELLPSESSSWEAKLDLVNLVDMVLPQTLMPNSDSVSISEHALVDAAISEITPDCWMATFSRTTALSCLMIWSCLFTCCMQPKSSLWSSKTSLLACAPCSRHACSCSRAREAACWAMDRAASFRANSSLCSSCTCLNWLLHALCDDARGLPWPRPAMSMSSSEEWRRSRLLHFARSFSHPSWRLCTRSCASVNWDTNISFSSSNSCIETLMWLDRRRPRGDRTPFDVGRGERASLFSCPDFDASEVVIICWSITL
mmetsp:Transcript_79140/g.242121  ORF Transcript_79140/g.242121 Transcript_79140/m.242121 type:complete len:280 (-) Transcript_79140:320-1159(-)